MSESQGADEVQSLDFATGIDLAKWYFEASPSVYHKKEPPQVRGACAFHVKPVRCAIDCFTFYQPVLVVLYFRNPPTTCPGLCMAWLEGDGSGIWRN